MLQYLLKNQIILKKITFVIKNVLYLVLKLSFSNGARMCLTPISIEIAPARSSGIRFASVPCGKCEECRKSNKNAWSFRLGCELETKKNLGWSIGFLTLTYSDENLPYIPQDCLKEDDNRKIPCFSRKHLRNFIDNLRKRMFEVNENYTYSDKLVYFGASEYGSTTRRPHYHVMLCWNPALGLSEPAMFELVKANWKHGFIFPKDFEGGTDGHGYYHKPFIVQASAYNAARYCSKYVCKDLTYETTLDGVNKSMESFKDCKYFHMQSKSLGFSVLANATIEQKKKLLLDGYAFQGEESFIPIPLYIKKKLIFDNYYIYVDEHLQERKKVKGVPLPEGWKRLSRIKASEFFKENSALIFKKQVEFYESLFNDFKDSSFCWRMGYYDFNESESFRKNIESKRNSVISAISEYEVRFKRSFVSDFVGFGCIDYFCAYDVSNELLYLNRYSDFIDFTGVPLIDKEIFNTLHDIVSSYFDFFRHAKLSRMTENDLLLSQVDDFCNNFMEVH